MSDRNPDPLRVDVPAGYAWHGQFRHALMLAALLPGAWTVAGPSLEGGSWQGIDTKIWFWLALAVPVVHQVLVALVWRAQLCHALVTRVLGEAALRVWAAVFVPLLLARPVLLVAVGLADRGSLALPPAWSWGLGALFLLPAAWASHSVGKYFGVLRAVGGDHFFERFRAMPMVREGAFAHTSNAMYGVVFLGLWGVALILQSRAALAVALFQHAYIWVHWYCTEQPDGVVLYGRSADED